MRNGKIFKNGRQNGVTSMLVERYIPKGVENFTIQNLYFENKQANNRTQHKQKKNKNTLISHGIYVMAGINFIAPLILVFFLHHKTNEINILAIDQECLSRGTEFSYFPKFADLYK